MTPVCMDDPISIVELTDAPEDLGVLKQLYMELYVKGFPDPDECESLENIVEYLRLKASGWYSTNNYHVVVALKDGVPVGLSISDYLAQPNAGVIEFILTAESTRRTGLGTRILTATENLLRTDALKSTGLPLAWVVGEVNDPFKTPPSSDSIDPVERCRIWGNRGFRRLCFPYEQPALAVDKKPVTNLLLVTKTFIDEFEHGVPATLVCKAIHEYMHWTMRIPRPLDNPSYIRMTEYLSGMDIVPLRPLLELDRIGMTILGPDEPRDTPIGRPIVERLGIIAINPSALAKFKEMRMGTPEGTTTPVTEDEVTETEDGVTEEVQEEEKEEAPSIEDARAAHATKMLNKSYRVTWGCIATIVFLAILGAFGLLPFQNGGRAPTNNDYEQSGIGALLDRDTKTEAVTVTKVYPGTPADKAGLAAGDEILAIDMVSVRDFWSIDRIGEYLRDERKPDVELLVIRKSRFRDDKYGVVKLSKIRFACMYQENEERTANKRFMTLKDAQGFTWVFSGTRVMVAPATPVDIYERMNHL